MKNAYFTIHSDIGWIFFVEPEFLLAKKIVSLQLTMK